DSASDRFTVDPDGTVSVAVAADRPLPLPGTVASTDAPALMLSAAVSPAAPLTHFFCKLTCTEPRVLVKVHVIVWPAALAGTVNLPAVPVLVVSVMSDAPALHSRTEP